MVADLEKEAIRVEVKINTYETKIVSMARHRIHIYISSQNMKGVRAQLPDSMFNNAKSTFTVFSNIWKCNCLNTNINLRLFCAYLLYVLPHGSSTREVIAIVTWKLQAFLNSCRRFLKEFWLEAETNVQVLPRKRNCSEKGRNSTADGAMQWNPIFKGDDEWSSLVLSVVDVLRSR